MALILRGTVVGFDSESTVLRSGAVYIGDDGKLAAVAEAGAAAPIGFAAAREIETDGVIYPGLIDMHSHIAYNTLPLWEAVGAPYAHHDSWTREQDPPDYGTAVSWPARVVQQAAPEALIKYVEVKALVGGTTAIQGGPRTTRPVDGWLIRIVDNERFGGERDLTAVSALQKRPDQLLKDARKLSEGGILIYHVAEGTPGSPVVREFADLERSGCVQPGLIGVHANALSTAELERWRKAAADHGPGHRPTIVWSPFSNYWLYRQTSEIAAAHKKKFRIALGSDWSPSGTKHVLGELKVADLLNKRRLDRTFTSQELCEMVTANPGDALAIAYGRTPIGRLIPGAEADVIVVERHKQDPYRNLIDATERHIQLVIVRGQPFYGTSALMSAAGAQGTNAITIAGERRSVRVRRPGSDARLTWPQVVRALEHVRADPKEAWNGSQQALAAWGGPLDAPEAPLAIFGDMPEGDLGLLGAAGEIPEGLKIPPLDSLEHDAAFFAAVKRAKAPPMEKLAGYYS